MTVYCYASDNLFENAWGDNPREGGRIVMLIPLPLLGFLPQSPTFLLPHPPLGCDAKLHRTVLNRVWRLKSWEKS